MPDDDENNPPSTYDLVYQDVESYDVYIHDYT